MFSFVSYFPHQHNVFETPPCYFAYQLHVHFFFILIFWLSSLPLCPDTTIYVPIHLLIDISVISSVLLL